jgi:hypothetical protein
LRKGRTNITDEKEYDKYGEDFGMNEMKTLGE